MRRKAGLGGTGPSDTTLFTRDARSRLTQVEAWPADGAHTVITFGYDALGRRVKKTVNGVTQWFVYDGDHVVLDIAAATGAVQAEYGYRPGVDHLFAVRTPGWTGITITDPQIGTVRGLANAATGATIKEYSYTAWGETGADTGFAVRPRLAGREYDQETGLYFNRARYYDPEVGRFLSEDPIGIEGGLNLYAYAANDPINGRDPWGLLIEGPDYILDEVTVTGTRPWDCSNIWYRLTHPHCWRKADDPGGPQEPNPDGPRSFGGGGGGRPQSQEPPAEPDDSYLKCVADVAWENFKVTNLETAGFAARTLTVSLGTAKALQLEGQPQVLRYALSRLTGREILVRAPGFLPGERMLAPARLARVAWVGARVLAAYEIGVALGSVGTGVGTCWQ